MTDVTPINPPAGWYPDPWNAIQQRYWDGAAWTAYTATPTAQQESLAPTGRYDAAAGARAARFGRIGIMTRAAVTPILVGLLGTVAAVVISIAVSQSQNDNGTNDGGFGAGSGAAAITVFIVILLAGNVLSYVGLGYLMAWTYRICENARDLGVRTRFSSGLACCSWLIPYANIVLPYMSVKGAVPREDDAQAYLNWWLIFMLLPIAGVFGLVFAIGLAFIHPVAAALGALITIGIGVTIGVIEYRAGMRIVRMIQARHDGIAAALATRT